MAFAKNGAAIIGDMVVPAAEVTVLKTLVDIGRPATVPEIATMMNDKMSDASLYSLLGRLDERRRLVTRQAVVLDVHGTSIRRVMWSVSQAATEFFQRHKHAHEETQKALPPAGATGKLVEEAG